MWEKLIYWLNYNYFNVIYELIFMLFSFFNFQGLDRFVILGDKILGQLEYLVKFYVDYVLMDKVCLGVEVILVFSQYFRGDEVNENEKIDGYVIVNIYVLYWFNDIFIVLLCVNNVFDKDYEIFGMYGEVDEVLEDIYFDVEGVEFVGFV